MRFGGCEGAQPLVHGVVDAVVGFGCYDYLMAVVGGIGTLNIVVDDGEGMVGGCTVDNEVAYVWIVLAEHAVEGSLKECLGILCNGDV